LATLLLLVFEYAVAGVLLLAPPLARLAIICTSISIHILISLSFHFSWLHLFIFPTVWVIFLPSILWDTLWTCLTRWQAANGNKQFAQSVRLRFVVDARMASLSLFCQFFSVFLWSPAIELTSPAHASHNRRTSTIQLTTPEPTLPSTLATNGSVIVHRKQKASNPGLAPSNALPASHTNSVMRAEDENGQVMAVDFAAFLLFLRSSPLLWDVSTRRSSFSNNVFNPFRWLWMLSFGIIVALSRLIYAFASKQRFVAWSKIPSQGTGVFAWIARVFLSGASTAASVPSTRKSKASDSSVWTIMQSTQSKSVVLMALMLLTVLSNVNWGWTGLRDDDFEADDWGVTALTDKLGYCFVLEHDANMIPDPQHMPEPGWYCHFIVCFLLFSC
jgi:hypothetical protein